MDTFKPSIDWGSELARSVVWIFAASAISAVCVLLILAAVVRYTTFGRRFWAITGGYFTGTASLPAWGLLVVMMLSVISSVRILVLMSYYNNDLHSALQMAFEGAASHHESQRDSGVHGFWVAIGTFVVLALVNVARIVFDNYVTQQFIIRWRVWLTARFTGNWLATTSTIALGSSNLASTIPISASSRTSTCSPPGWAPAPMCRPITPKAC